MIFDHLGVVVKDLENGRAKLSRILKIEDWTQEFADSLNGVTLQFGRDASGMCYELLEPLGSDSPLLGALTNGRAILNHVAYRVADLPAAAEELRVAGCARTGDPKPAIAYGGNRVQFFVTPLRFVIELVEAPAHQHEYLRIPFPESAQTEKTA